MGCCHSSLQRKEVVSRCKARRRYMRELSEGRQAFATAHSLYLHFLRSTGAALLQFANAEVQLHVVSPSLRLPPPPPRPPLSRISDNWTSSVTASPILTPPPPPPPLSSAWDFWDPFAPASSCNSVTEEVWEEAASAISEVNTAPATTPPPSVISGFSKDSTVELAVVAVPMGKKYLSEIVKELDEYFVKASETGRRVSTVLEAPSCGSALSNQGYSRKMSSYCKSFSPLICSGSSSPRTLALTSYRGSMKDMSRVSHCCTIEKLYAWEKKLYLEVKNSERTRVEKEKRLSLLRRQEAKGMDYFKVLKNKKEIGRLESKLLVYCQAIETTSSEIIRLREVELFPQLLDLVNGWYLMQKKIKYIRIDPELEEKFDYIFEGVVTTGNNTFASSGTGFGRTPEKLGANQTYDSIEGPSPDLHEVVESMSCFKCPQVENKKKAGAAFFRSQIT